MTTRFAKSFTGPGNTIDLADGENAIVMPGIAIASTDGIGISGSGSYHRIGVFGSVGGDVGGIAITGGYQTRVNIGTQGSVAADHDAISLKGNDSRVVNHGSLVSLLEFGVEFDSGVVSTTGPGNATKVTAILNNFGTISGELGVGATSASLFLTNHGTITGLGDTAIYTQSSDSLIKNYGLIVGTVFLSDGIDTVYNRGHVEGGIYTGAGADLVDNRGGTIDGLIVLDAGDDKFIGGADDEHVLGGSGNDMLNGGAGADVLAGNVGNDILIGGAGDDILNGESGVDDLTGGAGADLFVFNKAAGAKPAEVDTIRDFSSADGDHINLSGIDAIKATKPNDAFTFIDTQAFHNVAGELRYDITGDHLTVYADMTGDSVADLTFIVFGATGLAASDFVL